MFRLAPRIKPKLYVALKTVWGFPQLEKGSHGRYIWRELFPALGTSQEWWLVRQNVKQPHHRKSNLRSFWQIENGRKILATLANMLRHIPDKCWTCVTDHIGSAFYFTTDDHGRPNQRVVSGPDGQKILPPSKKQWPSLAASWVLPNLVCLTDKLRQRVGKLIHLWL